MWPNNFTAYLYYLYIFSGGVIDNLYMLEMADFLQILVLSSGAPPPLPSRMLCFFLFVRIIFITQHCINKSPYCQFMQMHEAFIPCVYLVTSMFNVEECWVILLVREHGCPLRILLTSRVECLLVSTAMNLIALHGHHRECMSN